MLEEVLDNTRLWNSDSPIGGFGMRVTASNGLCPSWLDDKIKELSLYEDIYYGRLQHPKGKSADWYKRIAQKFRINMEPFSLPLLRLKSKKPKKKALLQAIHADEWAATEAIMRFVDDWGKGKVSSEIKEGYEITAIPLLSIDTFPRHHGSMNYNSDVRLETIKPELDSADIVIELHESSIKNQSMILTPLVYSVYGLVLAGSYLKFTRVGRKKARQKVQSKIDEFRKIFSSDIEVMYSNDGELIERITSELEGLKVEIEESAQSYSRRIKTKDGKPNYGVELCSDLGEIGEPFLLLFSVMMAYPLTEVSTYLNRTLRRNQIRQSRLQSAMNGNRVIQSILKANL